MRYKDYFIFHNPKPFPLRELSWDRGDWDWVHIDYDGAEDGRCGVGASVMDCKAEIDMLEDNNG